MKLYTNVAKGLKLKVRNILGLIPTFLVVTGGKLLRGAFFVSQFGIFFRNVFKNRKLKTIKIKLKLKFMKIQISTQNTKTICKNVRRGKKLSKLKTHKQSVEDNITKSINFLN